MGRYKEAEVELRQRIAALPTNDDLRFNLAQSYLMQGKDRESMEELVEALRLEGDERRAMEVRDAFNKEGNQGVQEWRLARLKEIALKRYVSPLEFAFAYARLGQADETFRWLEKAYDDHAPWLVQIHQHSELDPFRGDPRYTALIKRIGLPQSH